MITNYIFSGYRIYKYDEPVVMDGVTYKFYTPIKGRMSDKITNIPFKSLADARKWCKDNYLLGVYRGWVN